jgi:hypothetical protein
MTKEMTPAYCEPCTASHAAAATMIAPSRPPPSTVAEARANLAESLMQAWDLNQEEALFSNSPRGVSGPRQMLNQFVTEVGTQLSSRIGPVCMDWSSKYVKQFTGCTQVIDFKYERNGNTFRPAASTQMGLITGDLGENMSHVPPEVLDFAIVTQVFEHVPHFWNALPNLARMIKQETGLLLFSVPWAYQFHPYPGDFYRYSPLAIYHLLESSGFAVCQFVSDGWRTLQLQALGLELRDIEQKKHYIAEQSIFNLLKGGSNYNVIAQRVKNIGDPCTLPRLKLTNEVTLEQLKKKTGGFWPRPMSNFPFNS